MLAEELYDALLEAGASEEKARAASRTVAVGDIQADLKDLRTEMRTNFKELRDSLTDVKGDVRVLKWMLPFILAMLTAVLFKVFS